MRIVFLIEDSLPNGRVGPELTPMLWSLIEEGGWNPSGGVSVLASSTYPNHASFVTGTDVSEHRIFTNDVWDGSDFVCSSTVGPRGDTVFDVSRRKGLSTAAVLGDQTMVGVMDATSADFHWPPRGDLPAEVDRDCLGYAGNSAVLDVLASSDALDADLTYIHFNEPDSTLHTFGPEAAETISRIRTVDDDLATVVEMLRPSWRDTVLFVVSDHEQETIDGRHGPIDLASLLSSAGLPGHAHNEGAVGIVYDGPGAERVGQLPDISGAVDVAVDASTGATVTLAWSGPGRVFGTEVTTKVGQHGSPRTRTQVAAVSGGHPVVGELAKSIRLKRPSATFWAPMIMSLLSRSEDEHR